VELDFDGVEDCCEVPVAVGLVKIYNRALRDEEVLVPYRGYRVVKPVAKGLFVMTRKRDKTIFRVLLRDVDEEIEI